MSDAFFPSWVDGRIVADDAFAQAYAAVSDRQRAWLKTTIARHQALYGFPECDAGSARFSLRQGGAVSVHSRPADWCIAVLGKNYASGPRLLAATLPALLSGVRAVCVVRIGADDSWPAAVLTACELAGIELVADMTPDAAVSLIQEVHARGRGRVMLLGNHEQVGSVGQICAAADIAAWREPHISCLAADSAADKDVLRWAHPGVDVVEATSASAARALVAAAQKTDICRHAIVHLGTGQEGLFYWPQLSRAFFTEQSVSFTG